MHKFQRKEANTLENFVSLVNICFNDKHQENIYLIDENTCSKFTAKI